MDTRHASSLRALPRKAYNSGCSARTVVRLSLFLIGLNRHERSPSLLVGRIKAYYMLYTTYRESAEDSFTSRPLWRVEPRAHMQSGK